MKIVKTKTSDGLILNGLLSEVESKNKKIIVHIHGMPGSIMNEDYFPTMHEMLPRNGVSCLVGENRGLGTITGFNTDGGNDMKVIGNAFEKFEECVIDIQAWVNQALRLGYSDIWLFGHSLGCSKIAYFLQECEHNNISGAVLLSPADMIGLTREPSEKENIKAILEEANKNIALGQDERLLKNKLWGSEILSAKTAVNFFGARTNLAVFNFFDGSLGWKTVNSIDVPVLAITGTKDDGIVPVMDPYEAMKKLKQNLIGSNRVSTLVYEGAEHPFVGFGERIVDDVLRFIG